MPFWCPRFSTHSWSFQVYCHFCSAIFSGRPRVVLKWNPSSADMYIRTKKLSTFFQWNTNLFEQLRFCYSEICFLKNSACIVKNMLMNLLSLITESENVPVSQLNASVNLCKIVLQHFSKHGRKFIFWKCFVWPMAPTRHTGFLHGVYGFGKFGKSQEFWK